MDERTRGMLMALGDGGTVEMATRALAHVDGKDVDLEVANLRSRARVLAELELGGVTEVAGVLQVSRQTIGHWVAGRRPGPFAFPPPSWHLVSGPVWDMSLIRQLTVTEGEVKPGDQH